MERAGGVGARHVAVVGAGTAGAELSAAARRVGRELGSTGAVLVCGGLGGVMAAACQGARESGGLTLGLLPGLDRAAANPWVSIAVPTGLGEARNALVVRAADAVIALGGGWGTLSEIALAVKAGVPVVGFDTWRVQRPGGEPGAEPGGGIVVANDATAAVRTALALAATAAPPAPPPAPP